MPFGRNGWSIGVTCDRDELFADVTKLNQANIFITLVGFIILLTIIILVAVSITRPLISLALVARELAAGNFNVVIPEIHSRDEIGELIGAFTTMRNELKVYISNLMQATANRERIESELSIARTIQLESLPTIPSVLNNSKMSFDLYATMEPAEKVGGDLYDFFMSDDKHLFFMIGDVSGKGVSAAMFMITIRVFLKSVAVRYADPAIALTQLNRKICSENSSCMFVTLVVCMLDIRTGELWIANAGHDAPLVRRQDGSISSLEVHRGPACGIDPSTFYAATRITLPPQTTLLLFTDGVTEAENAKKEFFSSQNLVKLVEKLPPLKPELLVKQVLDAVKSFRGTADQTDDIALLALYFRSKKEDLPIDEVSLRVPSDPLQLDLLHKFIADFCSKQNLGSRPLHDIQLVVEEFFINICKYAFPDRSGDHLIHLTLSIFSHEVVWVIEDDGVPFNPLDHPSPIVNSNLDEMTVGGQGIHLAKRLMDQLAYVRENERNKTVGSKNLIS